MDAHQSNRRWSYGLAIAACLGGALWYWSDAILPLIERQTEEAPAPVAAVKQAKRGPQYPLAQPAPPLPEEKPFAVEPLPPLGDSDNYARQALEEDFGPAIADILSGDDIIYKLVAATDSLTSAQIPRKIWPVTARLPAFAVIPANNGKADQFFPSADNYQRYDLLVDLATGADPETLAITYRQMYPLLQETYIGLGYPDGYFNDRLVEVIDELLRTPQPAEPALLVRPHVLYQYADPDLEALSGGQKLLLRMGNDNARQIKQMLRSFRELIVQSPQPATTEPATP